jgi:hypothetical protein
MELQKSTRHQKIIGAFGENLLCNWLSRSGFEVSVVDHTGIDIIAYNIVLNIRLGITVKSRTRIIGTEKESVFIFSNEKNERQKTLSACKYFACEPWIAIYVETQNNADVYLTSLENYDNKYQGNKDKANDDWKMTGKYISQYVSDPFVKHIHIEYNTSKWVW